MKTNINNQSTSIHLGKVNASTWNTIINAVSRLIPVIANLFGGSGNKDNDPWNSWDAAGRREFVRQGLEIATKQYLQGSVNSIDQAMAVIIGQVETDVTYDYWKNHANNTEWKAMVNQAQVNADKKKNNILATLFNPNMLLWALGFSVVGFGVYWFRFKDKPDQLQQHNITTKKLT